MPYIERIIVSNHFRTPDRVIDLRQGAQQRPRHLILTGPNGSGKTTILERIAEAVDVTLANAPPQAMVQSKEGDDAFRAMVGWTASASNVASEWQDGRFIVSWLPDNRLTEMEPVEGQRELWSGPVASDQRLAPKLHQYLVNQFIERGLYIQDGDDETAAVYGRRIARIEHNLSALFEREGLKLKRRPGHPGRVALDIVEPGWDPIPWHVLAAGHRSVLQMLAELALRIDAGDVGMARDDERLSGVALIDEMALHLHPSLQEKILPLLVAEFPRIQFIVATHSPAIISSIDGALVVDLRPAEDGTARPPVPSEELRGMRYGDLMVGHFGIETDFDLESTREMARLFALWKREARTLAEDEEMRVLAKRLANRSHALALEITMRAERLEGEQGR